MNNSEPLPEELEKRFASIEQIRDGEMCNVYRAEERRLNIPVVVKVLKLKYASDIYLKRFSNAAKLNACLSHPNICKVLDFGAVSGMKRPFVMLPFHEGPTLTELVKKEGPLTPEIFCDTFAAICDAMQHAHENRKRIVHRSLKPDNIIMSKVDGEIHPIIIDFGFADALGDDSGKQLWQMGETVGVMCDFLSEPEQRCSDFFYLSPEHCMGHKIVETSDIYSLGCCMYFALTGEPPFVGRSAIDAMQMHIAEQPARGKLPPNSEPIVLKTLEKQSKDRFQSMAELRDAILKAKPHQNKKKLGFSFSRVIKG